MSEALKLLVAATRGDFDRAVQAATKEVADADAATMREVTDLAKTGGRRAIASAGFSVRWQNALRSRIWVNDADRVGGTAGQVSLQSSYGGIFDKGGDITGKPTVWLPILDNLPRSTTKWTPSAFNAQIGKLSFVPAGNGHGPMLVGKVAIGKAGKTKSAPLRGNSARAARSRTNFFVRSAAKTLPMFVGLESVHIGKKFDIEAAADVAMKQYPDIFAKNLKAT